MEEEKSAAEFSNHDEYENEAVMYLMEQKQRAQRSSLARHTQLSSQVEELDQNIKVGSFYEVDHFKLSPKSPEQLFSIRIVMVSEKNSNGVSLRFPSVHSLWAHFSESDGKKLPALDEKYVMSSDMAARALFRRIPPQEMAEDSKFWSFWSEKMGPTKKASSSSLSDQLRVSGLVQWGQRRQVRFLNPHEEFSGLSGENENKEEGEEEEEEKAVEEDVSEEEVEPLKNRRSSKRKLLGKNTSKAESSKRAKSQNKKQTANARSKSKSVMNNSVARWSLSRYKLAEENMLKIMKAKGAFLGNPMLRPALRNEARKLIGDTGLLDHLLKHMAGKVAPGGTDRFRRRHNSDGAMEYWIESADLVEIRKQAGVQDTYWTPPPGWKPGDNPIQDSVSAREIDSLKQDISNLNEIIHEVVSGQMRLEEKVVELQEELKARKSGGTMLSDLEAPPPLSLTSDREIPRSEDHESELDKGKKIKTFTPNLGSVQVHDQGSEEDRATRIQRLKSGFRLFKPQASFLWPNMAHQHYDTLVVPTPPSASSTSAPPGSHHLASSPVKPRPLRPTISNMLMLNLNEAPVEQNTNEAAMSSLAQAEKGQGDEGKEQERECSSDFST